VIRYSFHSEAEAEYVAAAAYYAAVEAQLGQRFFDEIERLIQDVREQPDRFRLFDPPIRRHFSLQFPYAILYALREDRILIVAVMHMKRQPGYWKNRLG